VSADEIPFDTGEWKVVQRVRKPWGQVPLTAGGQALHGRSRDYMDRLLEQARAPDLMSRRHHYVPKTYLKQWSFDGKRVWTLDTVTVAVSSLGLSDVCVEENFYRVNGPGGEPHNRVELMFGVVDSELRRVQSLFNRLKDPDELEFDDLIASALAWRCSACEPCNSAVSVINTTPGWSLRTRGTSGRSMTQTTRTWQRAFTRNCCSGQCGKRPTL
jgi:hypothetical protein